MTFTVRNSTLWLRTRCPRLATSSLSGLFGEGRGLAIRSVCRALGLRVLLMMVMMVHGGVMVVARSRPQASSGAFGAILDRFCRLGGLGGRRRRGGGVDARRAVRFVGRRRGREGGGERAADSFADGLERIEGAAGEGGGAAAASSAAANAAHRRVNTSR